jgi:hypothetical protein
LVGAHSLALILLYLFKIFVILIDFDRFKSDPLQFIRQKGSLEREDLDKFIWGDGLVVVQIGQAHKQ